MSIETKSPSEEEMRRGFGLASRYPASDSDARTIESTVVQHLEGVDLNKKDAELGVDDANKIEHAADLLRPFNIERATLLYKRAIEIHRLATIRAISDKSLYRVEESGANWLALLEKLGDRESWEKIRQQINTALGKEKFKEFTLR